LSIGNIGNSHRKLPMGYIDLTYASAYRVHRLDRSAQSIFCAMAAIRWSYKRSSAMRI
jgi:hypothetical protein